jgi:gamma-glutamylputrescine oxidase
MNNRYQPSWWEIKELQSDYDLIVIGAGLTGLFTSLFYKRRFPEKKVLILDRGFYPDGASTRNAGFACFGSAGELLDDLENEEESEVIARLGARYSGLQKLRHEMGDSILGYEEPGGHELFIDKDSIQKVEPCLEMFNEWMYGLSGQKGVYAVSSYQGHESVFCTLEGRINSGRFMKNLITKTEQEGVKIRWNSPVAATGSQYVELVSGIKLETRKILLATNGFTSELLPDSGIKPARGYVFVTRPLKRLDWRGIFHFDCGYYYFRDLPDNSLLLGGARNLDKIAEETTSRDINPDIRSHLISFAKDTLRLPEGWDIEYEWTGTMGFGKTKTPVCRKVTDGLYMAAGLSGMGVAIGIDLAERASEMLASS